MEKRNHWEKIYEIKKPEEVSWTQEKPEASLEFIRSFSLPKTAKIIDVGGGDNRLVDFLLEEGYEYITVLDISEKALERAKKRLGNKADKASWIVTDIVDFKPESRYDVWHDWVAFHFLTRPEQIQAYQEITAKTVSGYMVIGTFSENGPDKCSGPEIKKYSGRELEKQW